MVLLSPAERTYLFDSLSQSPPKRPDSRPEYKFRPLEATTSFLPGSNGSARIRLVDGSECIVSVKSKVVLLAREASLIEVDVDVSGFRDDSNFVGNLKYNLTDLMVRNFPLHYLKLTTKYSYKLFVDCIVVSHSSYPLSMLSLTSYLALKTTRLPKLVSEIDDSEIEEQPTFSDDWEQAQLLATLFQQQKFQPPLFITVGVAGNNLILDPSLEEEQVLENGLILGWYDGKVIAPIFNVNLTVDGNNTNFRGVNPTVLSQAVAMVKKHCGLVVKALDMVVEQDEETTIF